MVVVLILWRRGRHHKHSNTPHTTPSRAAQSHPPITLCEETGQVYYSTVQELPQLSQQASEDTHNQDDTYSHLKRTEQKTENQSKEDIGEYSKLSTSKDGESCLYAQVNKKEKNRSKVAVAAGVPECDDSISQLYAQVDKKKMKKRKGGADNNPPEAVDQLYAQVDKKRHREEEKEEEEKEEEEEEKKEEEGVCEDPQELATVYAVVKNSW